MKILKHVLINDKPLLFLIIITFVSHGSIVNFEVFIECRLIVPPGFLHVFDADMKKVKAIK